MKCLYSLVIQELEGNPGKVNESPLSEGWFIKLKVRLVAFELAPRSSHVLCDSDRQREGFGQASRRGWLQEALGGDRSLSYFLQL